MPIKNPDTHTEDATELYVGMDLRGYRSWVPDWDGDNTPILRPVHRGRLNIWTPGVNEAQCFRGEQPDSAADGCGVQVPNPNCDCGFYGFFDPAGPNKGNLDLDIVTPCVMSGVIQGTGHVLMAERGFRAEKAELVALSPPRHVDPAVRFLAAGSSYLWQYEWARHQISHIGRCTCVWCRLDRNDALAPPLELLAERYGVPWFNSFTDMTKEFPPTHQDKPEPALPCIHDVLGIPHGAAYSMAIPGVNVGMLQLTPTGVVPVSLPQQLAGTIAGVFEHIIASVFRQPWPQQPSFTGSPSSVVRKFWRWALTGSTSDTLE